MASSATLLVQPASTFATFAAVSQQCPPTSVSLRRNGFVRVTSHGPSSRQAVETTRSSPLSYVTTSKSHKRTARLAITAAAAEAGDAAIDEEAEIKNEKVLVLGGSGFVGSAVAKAAADRGIDVVSLSRSGRSSISNETWANSVIWETGDVFSANWPVLLKDVTVVVSCIGGFGTDEQMERINGDATVVAVDAAKDSGVRKFVFVSVHDYNLPDFAKENGYFNGKKRAETAVLDAFPNTGVVLRPGFIYGKRRVTGGVEVPLDLIGQPLEKLLSATKDITKLLSPLPASDLLLAPPVDVADLASVAVRAVVDDSIAGVAGAALLSFVENRIWPGKRSETGIDLTINSVQITSETDFAKLANEQPWMNSTRMVVKPDMLFGKRGKSGLVALDLDFAGVEAFVKSKLGKEVEMGQSKGPITTFIVEPFIPHKEEYYLSITSKRLGCDVSFSECGGVNIEENWDKVKTIFVPTESELTSELCAPLIATLPLEVRENMEKFIKGVFAVFKDLDFTLIEMNPFIVVNGEPFPLDMRGELDDTAQFKHFQKWGDVEFPLPFGRTMTPSEERIHEMDEKTGASLKLTILNPKGRIWTMVAGGGASVIYADTVGDLGYAQELGNYAEYSGAPNEEETLQYARILIDCATANPDGRPRALLIGGGIANFTDVAKTFSGIIRALREKERQIKDAKVRIFVRRGGPNYLKGLEKMRELGAEIGIPIQVYGPEASMTCICKEAIDYVASAAA
ncbi:unnamed protein product [Closterium sp. Yama58-4]|nr:unnamed protein product [Closterium sp. Yama58-4]